MGFCRRDCHLAPYDYAARGLASAADGGLGPNLEYRCTRGGRLSSRHLTVSRAATTSAPTAAGNWKCVTVSATDLVHGDRRAGCRSGLTTGGPDGHRLWHLATRSHFSLINLIAISIRPIAEPGRTRSSCFT